MGRERTYNFKCPGEADLKKTHNELIQETLTSSNMFFYKVEFFYKAKSQGCHMTGKKTLFYGIKSSREKYIGIIKFFSSDISSK